MSGALDLEKQLRFYGAYHHNPVRDPGLAWNRTLSLLTGQHLDTYNLCTYHSVVFLPSGH